MFFLKSSAQPFASRPLASRETYLELFERTRQEQHPEIDAVEKAYGFQIDKDWMDQLALHTQIVIKKSKLNYQHGRVLYAALRHYLARRVANQPVMIFETGTGRGFATLCMARAMADANTDGLVTTIDRAPHHRKIYWNCIDDHEGTKTRAELLAPYAELQRIIFIHGFTQKVLETTYLPYIDFAFLDAAHTYEDVMKEFAYVSARQTQGNVIVFDDVTAGTFPGVVKAIDEIESQGTYSITRLQPSNARGYAIAQKH